MKLFWVAIWIAVLLVPTEGQALRKHTSLVMDTPAATTTTTSTKDSSTTKDSGIDIAGDSKDGIAYIAIQIILSEIVDKTFYTALMLSFVYGAPFAFFSYFIGSAVSGTIAATVGKIFDVLPDQLMNIIVAACFVVYGLWGFIYIYQEKEAPSGDEDLEKKAKEKKEKEDEEKKGLLEKEKKDAKKDKEEAKPELHASRTLEFAGEEEKKKEEKTDEKKDKSLTESAISMSFLQSKWKRFLGALILFVVADLTDRSFETLWKLRDRNNLGYLLLVMLGTYLFLALVVLIVGWIINKKVIKEHFGKTDKSKMIKSAACAIMILLGLIQLFADDYD